MCAPLDVAQRLARIRHRCDDLHRELADRRLRRQHHGVGAVQHGVRNIEDLCPCWHGIVNHRFHHLRGGDHHAVSLSGRRDEILLNTDQLCVAYLDTEVTARHHHAIAGIDNAVQQFCIGHHFRPLDLRDNGRVESWSANSCRA